MTKCTLKITLSEAVPVEGAKNGIFTFSCESQPEKTVTVKAGPIKRNSSVQVSFDWSYDVPWDHLQGMVTRGDGKPTTWTFDERTTQFPNQQILVTDDPR